ncbi:hypothetical protein QTV49_001739 [Vibrio vulnificus]|nr:hypothetical protein [Vibrio vulnificus]
MSITSEAVLLSTKDLSKFGDILKVSVRCFHQTRDLKSAKNIEKNGFNLKRFGDTARLYGAPEFLWKHDPVAVFASVKHVMPNNNGGFVELIVKDANTLQYAGKTSAELKRQLYEYLECSSAKDFSDKLKDLGVDAIASSDEIHEEVIIINTNKIKIVKSGLEVNPQPNDKQIVEPVRPTFK